MSGLHIGGFRFDLHSKNALAELPKGSPYSDFTEPCAGGTAFEYSAVDVYLSPLKNPPVVEEKPLFEGPTWTMFSEGDLRRIVMHDRENPEPFWMAEFRTGGRRVDISYGRRQLTAAGKVVSPLSYPLDQLLLMYLLAEVGGVLVHAGGGVRNGGEIFAGPSGAGKTTMIRMLLADGFEMFSDDRIIVRTHEKKHLLFGTPWPGDARVAMNRCAELRHVHILQKAGDDRDESLDSAAALARIIPCCSLPWFDAPVLAQALDGLNRMLSDVPHSVCHFTKKAPKK